MEMLELVKKVDLVGMVEKMKVFKIIYSNKRTRKKQSKESPREEAREAYG
jgi:hypothetical protein